MIGEDLLWFGLIVGFVCGLLAFILGIALSCPDGEDEMDRRYQECLAAGGSFSKDDVDWSCTVADQ